MHKTLALFTVVTLLALPVAAGNYAKDGKDIVETAVAAGSFGTLVAALEAADLVEALQADGPFTVFAPTDEAFAKLPAGTVESLLEPENRDRLRSILTFHVVSGKVMASSVSDGLVADSLNGADLTFAVDESGAKVGGSKIVATDVVASNGVIHVIDTVLIPAE